LVDLNRIPACSGEDRESNLQKARWTEYARALDAITMAAKAYLVSGRCICRAQESMEIMKEFRKTPAKHRFCLFAELMQAQIPGRIS